MLNTLSISEDIKFGVLDIFRDIGMGIVNIIYSTINTLYDIANSINTLNLIQMLQDIDNSPFTKIFNAFFILAFIILFLFAVWKITFRIIDADNNDQPLFELFKEIIKCGVLIFSVVLLFNTTMDIGSNLSSAIYNNFNSKEATLGTTMKSAFMTVNESCYKQTGGEDTDKNNVDSLKDYLSSYTDLSSVNTMADFETKLRNGSLTTSHIEDSGAFNSRCKLYKQNESKSGEDYNFNYNYLFGLVVGIIFLIAIGFAVLMLGKRQIELAFLMVIAPLIFATSVGRKDQRSALYQQLASLVLQAGALMLLIGITSIMFNAIQNAEAINSLDYFPKIVTQSILYLGCAILLLTGSNTLTRFIGENVSANAGREMVSVVSGVAGFTGGIVGAGLGAAALGGRFLRGTYGLGQMARGAKSMAIQKGIAKNPSKFADMANAKAGKGISQIMRGSEMMESDNILKKAYGTVLAQSGKRNVSSAASKYDFENKGIKTEYQDRLSKKASKVNKGISNVVKGYGNLNARYYRGRRRL